MTNDPYIVVPTWENDIWSTTTFDTLLEFREFLVSLFKARAGLYEFDETALEFNAQAQKFNKAGYFCLYPEGSRDYLTYWEDQKAKCRNGVIFKNESKTWYLSRDYYMWINFLPINDKVKKKFDFPEVWDSQYHMALYEILAELHWMHAAILKKRQFGSSYFHMAKLINQIWFEETPILKMGASLKDYINEKGSWKFLMEYKSFLDDKTAWYRPMNPGKILMWQQQIEDTGPDGRSKLKGLKGVLQGVSFDQNDTAGVGGAIRFFFYEEAGIAPTMDKTVEYLFPALQSGDITTGTFIAAGSVGDLDQCDPLKEMIERPVVNSIYPVTTDLLDDKGTIGQSGLFIPEQWSMPPYIDKYGNSLVEEATAALNTKFDQWKKDLSPEKYQLRVSQHPRNIAEAFAYRKVSLFPQNLIAAQKRRIEDKEYHYEHIELIRDANGKIEPKITNKLPISEFPITKKTEDKTGALVVWERPDANASWGTYYASIDPVSEGKTTTSESLCSIYVYKNPVEVTRHDRDKTEVFIERDKIVAAWCGRFDDITKTHQRLEMIIEWYNSWTLIENNVSLFIQYMISKHKQRYLVPKDQIFFLKELSANRNVFQEYGWKNVSTIFKGHLLSYLIEYLREEIDVETKEDGTIVKTIYGIERIPDVMAMEEMKAYNDDVNVDRIVALASLIAFAKVQQANRGFRKRVENLDKNHLEKSSNLFKLNVSPFRHIGKSAGTRGSMSAPRSPFKNIR
jgi:hypothetical protein